jgi:uncharacterized membrane protein YphA (DoxX/SURF4 family)
MNQLPTLGRYLIAVALAAFAIQHFIYAIVGGGLGPPWILHRALWAWVMGAALLAVSASIVSRRCVLIVGSIFAAVLMVCVELLYGPRFAAGIHNPAPWTSAAELVCIGGAAFTLAGILSENRSRFAKRAITVGRLLFALPLVVFAVQHFLYADFIATLIPAWIPARLVWAYLVGVAFLGAAASIAFGLQRWLGAALLGTMFLLWVAILHAPRVAAASHNANEWTSLFVALALGGGAWVMAGSAAK